MVAQTTTAKESLLPPPTKSEAIAKPLDNISDGSLDRSQLTTFSDRQLATLAANYAATTVEPKALPEPSELTEQQWDSVLMNNRALHGYRHDSKLGTLVKASARGEPQLPGGLRKRAFLPYNSDTSSSSSI